MTAKHAPGPWTVERSPIGWVLSINGHDGKAVCYGGIEDANARLIAASPALLEALRDVLERIDLAGGLKDPFYKGGAPWAIKRARVLVAKVEGHE